MLPIITPPFVIGLGLILIFGRSGLVNQLLEWAFGIAARRAGSTACRACCVAQVFAFTPIAFLVLIGVVEGVSPDAWRKPRRRCAPTAGATFADVSLPLMRPGLANAFLISFIESIADFGNPILLGGNFGVLSTEIFFSVVGAQLDQGRAATLGILLLRFALGAFFAQRRVLGQQGLHVARRQGRRRACRRRCPTACGALCYGVALPWALLTVVIYAMALVGGFVETWGRDYTPTLRHYVKAFGIEWTAARHPLGRRRVELVLDDGQALGDRRAADRGARHPRRVPAHAAEASSASRRSSSARCCRSRFPAR